MIPTQSNEDVGGTELACSVYSMQGRREYMEDDFAIQFPPPAPLDDGGESEGVGERGEEPALFGVFDGHGGARVSQYARCVRGAEHIEMSVWVLGSTRTQECGE